MVTKKIPHTESGYTCNFDRKHYDESLSTPDNFRQKGFRASAGIWITVPAMAKLQEVDDFSEITNPSDMFIAMAKKCGVDIKRTDLIRTLLSNEPTPEKTAFQEEVKQKTEQIVEALTKEATGAAVLPQNEAILPALAITPADASYSYDQKLLDWITSNKASGSLALKNQLVTIGNQEALVDKHIMKVFDDEATNNALLGKTKA
jgi:hypothetical protein